LYDLGRASYSTVQLGFSAIYYGIGALTGNEDCKQQAVQSAKQNWSSLKQSGIDLAFDTGATAIPFIPAGTTKIARGLNKTEDLAKIAEKSNIGKVEKLGRQTSAVKQLDVNSRAIKTVKDIKGFTEHGIDQIIDRGIKPEFIKGAVSNPSRVIQRVDSLGRESFRYVGEKAVVNFNKAGKMITGWLK
jgi:hypothetical protein